jgi:hypothetical protein
MMTQSRRSFLRKLAAQAIAIPFGTFGYQALVSAAETPRLDPNDSAATALGYTHTAPNASKSCGGCPIVQRLGDRPMGALRRLPRQVA